ncbi:MAG: Mov34/MPN/PAD-1 family protein [Candidatus Hydrogenedentes bacterium]|nr:Mov34/MPN/PAD-1 family protein [Candidatus Hydrogenedentota bacterium]
MVTSEYRFTLELYTDDGAGLGTAAIEPDWGAAYEWARFDALRRGRLTPETFHGDGVVQPVWDEKIGQPHVSGMQVLLENVAEGDKAVAGAAEILPITYFRPLAEAASGQLVKKGLLQEGDTFHYRVSARQKNGEDAAGNRRILLREAGAPLAVHAGSLAAYLTRATVSGPDAADDIPVFFPTAVLDRIGALVRAAGPCETGGMLLGRLCRDEAASELFAEVTAQLPALHTEADSASLTFTGETWSAARDAIRLRGDTEILLGWYHSHPAKEWCKDCPPEKRRVCSLECFFSAADRQVHQTLFPHCYSIALVATDGQRGLRYDLYGWRRTQIVQRGYHTLANSHGAAAMPAPQEE